MVGHRAGYERSAPFYDLFDTKENVEFYLRYAQPAGEILDVGAGTGRIAIPLARERIVVHCIEPSPAMRKEFERKLAEEPELKSRISLAGGRAETFKCDRSFPGCILSGTFDHFLDHDERLASLGNISQHLEPGGVLVFDIFLGLMEEGPLRPAGEVVAGERLIRRWVSGRFLPGRRKETRLVFKVYEAGEVRECIEEVSLVGVVDREEVYDVLSKAGFEVRREWRGYDFRPYREGDPLLILEAIKRGGARSQHEPWDHDPGE
jgi:SAM-dependent methyltransferase